jgi:hypothetical protein
MDEYVNIQVTSWNRFLTRQLEIVPELVGRIQTFRFEEHIVTITLPQGAIDKIKEPHEASVAMDSGEDIRLVVTGWREDKGQRIPSMVSVQDVEVTIEIVENIKIHERMLTIPPNAYDLLDDKEKNKLNEVGDSYGKLAEAAFEHWIRLLRWKSRNGSIGRSAVKGHASGWSTYLRDRKSDHNVWMYIPPFTFYLSDPIGLDTWEEVDKSLKRDEESPLYFDLYFDGIEHSKIKDYQRSIVDFAVAAEVFLRSKVMDKILQILLPSVRKHIDRSAIHNYYDQFFPEILSDIGKTEYGNLKANLKNLFESRNAVLHSGNLLGMMPEQIRQYQSTVKELLSFDDHPEYWSHEEVV